MNQANKIQISLQDLANLFSAQFIGNSDIIIDATASLEKATQSCISFVSNKKYLSQLQYTKAGVIIISPQDLDYCKKELKNDNMNALIADNSYALFAKIHQYFSKYNQPNYHDINFKHNNIHPSAIIASTATISPSAKVGALTVIEDGCQVGENSIIGASCYIGNNVKIGNNCIINPNVSIYHQCTLNDEIIVHSGAVIGSDGFGFAPEFNTQTAQWIKIPQIGSVNIESKVEIGANTTIDRATFDVTSIGYGTKLDNQVQIAHNVKIGKLCVIAGCTAVAGSTTIGDYCIIGGSSQIAGHLKIADKTTISGGTSIMQSTISGQRITGVFPSTEHAIWEKNAAIMRSLHILRKKINKIFSLMNIK